LITQIYYNLSEKLHSEINVSLRLQYKFRDPEFYNYTKIKLKIMNTPKHEMILCSKRLDLNFKYKVFLNRFNLMYKNLPFANFTIKTSQQFFQMIEKSLLEQNFSLKDLLFSIWNEEYVNLIFKLIPKYNYYFLLSYKLWPPKRISKEKGEELTKHCELFLLKLIVLLSLDKNEFFLSVLQSQVLNEFYHFLTNKFLKHSPQTVIQYLNNVTSMVQEFIGLSIQFFLCVDTFDTLDDKVIYQENIILKIFKKYNLNRQAYEFKLCDYFSSDYLILFDKTFNGDYGESKLLKNREKLFDKITLVVEEISQENFKGNNIEILKYDLDLEEQKINIPNFLSEINESYFLKILTNLSEIHNSFDLLYYFLIGKTFNYNKK
jgi:hypothetical protein